MNSSSQPTRRSFLQRTGSVAAGAAILGAMPVPHVFAGEHNTIRLALIGCGGRGTGAVDNALSVKNEGPVKLWAMADLDPAKIKGAHDALKRKFGEQVDVPEDRRFLQVAGAKHGHLGEESAHGTTATGLIQRILIHDRKRDLPTDTIDRQQKKRQKDLLTQLGNRKDDAELFPHGSRSVQLRVLQGHPNAAPAT